MKKIIDWFRANFSWGEQPLEVVEEHKPKIQSSVIPESRKPANLSLVSEDEDEEKKKKKEDDDINKTEESEKIEKGDDDEKDDIETPTEAEPLNDGSLVVISMDEISDEQVDKFSESFKDGITHEKMIEVRDEISDNKVLKKISPNDEGYLRAVKRREQNLTSKYTPNVWRDPNTGRYISRKSKA